MRTVHHTTASKLRAVSFLALSTLAAASAIANTGSTDIYAPNGVTASFGSVSGQKIGEGNYNGSTGIYDPNGFLASFGPAGKIAPAGNVVRTGSTDIFGANGFDVSFGRPAPWAEHNAQDQAKPEAVRLGEHPAVIVARRGVQVDPTSNFYLHPARLSWSLQRPMSEDGPLEVIVAAAGQRAASRP